MTPGLLTTAVLADHDRCARSWRRSSKPPLSRPCLSRWCWVCPSAESRRLHRLGTPRAMRIRRQLWPIGNGWRRCLQISQATWGFQRWCRVAGGRESSNRSRSQIIAKPKACVAENVVLVVGDAQVGLAHQYPGRSCRDWRLSGSRTCSALLTTLAGTRYAMIWHGISSRHQLSPGLAPMLTTVRGLPASWALARTKRVLQTPLSNYFRLGSSWAVSARPLALRAPNWRPPSWTHRRHTAGGTPSLGERQVTGLTWCGDHFVLAPDAEVKVPRPTPSRRPEFATIRGRLHAVSLGMQSVAPRVPESQTGCTRPGGGRPPRR